MVARKHRRAQPKQVAISPPRVPQTPPARETPRPAPMDREPEPENEPATARAPEEPLAALIERYWSDNMAIAVALTNALQIEAKKAMEETVTLAVGDANRGLAEMHRQLTRAETLLSGQAGRCGTIAAGPRGMTHGILTCAMQASQESFAYGANVVTDVADAVGGAWLRLSQEGARMCGRVASVLDAMVAAAPAL